MIDPGTLRCLDLLTTDKLNPGDPLKLKYQALWQTITAEQNLLEVLFCHPEFLFSFMASLHDCGAKAIEKRL